MTSTYADTHCHLDFEAFDPDREALVQRAKEAGLAFLIIPGVLLENSVQAVELSQTYPHFCYAMAGIHPNSSKGFNAETLEKLRLLTEEGSILAIGEIGLDYYRDRVSPAEQRQAFEAQLTLAAETSLPVCIHDREATDDLLAILKDWWAGLPHRSPLKNSPGVMHAWSESYDRSLPFLEMGFVFGIGGPVSFKNAPDRHALVRELPLENIVLETDAPFLTPHPFRGRRNEPAYIPYIAEAIADLKGISLAELGQVTTEAARKLFRIPA